MAVGLALCLVFLTSACASSPRGGRSVDEASAAARAVPGIADASVELSNYRSGFTSKWGAVVFFRPASDFNGEDKGAVLRKLLSIAWSVNEHDLDNGVSLSARRGSELNLIDLARQTNLPAFASNEGIPYQITFSTSEMERMFGEWPGR